MVSSHPALSPIIKRRSPALQSLLATFWSSRKPQEAGFAKASHPQDRGLQRPVWLSPRGLGLGLGFRV